MKNIKVVYLVTAGFMLYLFMIPFMFVMPVAVWVIIFTIALFYDIRDEQVRQKAIKKIVR